jgi:hypothetical protein
VRILDAQDLDAGRLGQHLAEGVHPVAGPPSIREIANFPW